MSGDANLPRNPLWVAIRRQFRRFLGVLRSSDLSVLHRSDSSCQRRSEDDQATPPLADATSPTGTGPSGNDQAKRDRAAEQRWALLARRNHLPAFIKRYALRRMDVIGARDTVRYFRSRDLVANEETRISDGERVYVPVIWLTEL